MITNKVEYLRVIYEKGGEKKPVANKLIAEELGIAPSSVTEMIMRLKKEGLLEVEPYKGAMLTAEGVLASLAVIRYHRLWEVFLVEKLGYTWREAHEEAHLLEHASTLRLIERLDVFLNYPKTCPHGSLIPKDNKMGKEMKLMPLSELRKGGRGIIRRISEEMNLLDYLQRIELEMNVGVEIIEVSDYEGPILFNQAGKQISISFKAAQEVYLEVT
jgi:DtxR family Mn-dependent transcriptional regulator